MSGDPSLSSVIRRPSSLLPILAAVAGLLLFAAFPPLEQPQAAWFALIPLIIASRYVEGRAAFRVGFLAGAVFWLGSISWLHHVSWPGMVGLSLYCALYVGVFAWGCSLWLRRFDTLNFLANAGFMVFATALWVGLEYVRSVLCTGFPWNGLGVSQYRNLPVIQLASLGGPYVVSGLIVWVASSVAVTICSYLQGRGRWGRTPHVELMLGLGVVAFAFTWGWHQFRDTPPGATSLRVSLVQPDIPQDDKWDQEKVDMIYGRLRDLSTGALLAGKPDLIVWPETAVPDDVRTSEPSYNLVLEIVTNGVPLLVGSMDTAWPDEGKPVYYNSSFLFDRTGAITYGYDKQHLVIFGEYVPLRDWIPFMKALTPIGESFSEGHTGTVFRLEKPDVAFSALICFEDTIPYLARKMVRNGARFLVNQTNDAWFDPSAESRQHMAHCVFRCVENRVPAVRCSNSGVTCAIDRRGLITDVLRDGAGGTLFSGFTTEEVAVPGDAMELTFYTRHGDVFAWVCLALAGAIATVLAWSVKRQTLNVEGSTASV